MVYSSLERGEGRWRGLGEGRQRGVAGTEGGGSQGLPDHVEQRSCPLLEFWGALVLLKGPVPALRDEVSSSLCERRGVRAGRLPPKYLLQLILSAQSHHCAAQGTGLKEFPRAPPDTKVPSQVNPAMLIAGRECTELGSKRNRIKRIPP